MRSLPVRRVASGKVVLLGEHSVVYGRPAVATTIGRRLCVTVRPRNGGGDAADPRLGEALAVAARGFGVEPGGFAVDIDSGIPVGAGLGSSAAISVALVDAMAALSGQTLSGSEIIARARDVENVFHGTASGLDVAVVSHGGAIWFERGGAAVRPLEIAEPVDLVVGLSGELRRTDGPVAKLRLRVARDPAMFGRLFALAGELVCRGAVALRTGDWQALGAVFDAAHGVLNAFGVSTPTLERMVSRARAAGALGAKLTGAGGGGAIVALAPDRAADVVGALVADGFEAFVTTVPHVTREEPAPALQGLLS